MKKNNNKNDLGIWWIGTCHQNLVAVHLTVSDKIMATDDGRRRHDSSSDVQ